MELYTEIFIHQVNLSTEDVKKIQKMHTDLPVFEPIFEWLDETFGEEGWKHQYFVFDDTECFAFKNETERDYFVLRWV